MYTGPKTLIIAFITTLNITNSFDFAIPEALAVTL